MIIRSTHSLRALAAAAAAVLLAVTPLGAAAQSTQSTPATAATPMPADASTGSTVGAVIHPGDHLAISVYEHPDLSQVAIVQADGTIQYPLVGRVFVGGLSAAEAQNALAKALRKFVKHPIVALSVQQQGQISVLVLGNVKNSGKYQMRSGSRLTDAIAASAGVAQINGEYPSARISQDNTVEVVSLQKLLRDGDNSVNLGLEDNAIVYVTGAETIRVQVLGAVSRPGNVDVNEGDRLSMALARAGTEASAKPDLNRVYLTRVDPATGKTLPSYEINLYQALKRGDQRYDPILKKDDKIYVSEARQINGATIGILGLLGRLLGL